jgi:hypothetical protein
MNRPKILVRTLFVFILLAGLVAGLLVSTLAYVHAAPQPAHLPKRLLLMLFNTLQPYVWMEHIVNLLMRRELVHVMEELSNGYINLEQIGI